MRILKWIGVVVLVALVLGIGAITYITLTATPEDLEVGQTIEACNVAGRYIEEDLGVTGNLGVNCYTDYPATVTLTDDVYQVTFRPYIVWLKYDKGWEVLRWVPR